MYVVWVVSSKPSASIEFIFIILTREQPVRHSRIEISKWAQIPKRELGGDLAFHLIPFIFNLQRFAPKATTLCLSC
jgi:hypothetical protein